MVKENEEYMEDMKNYLLPLPTDPLFIVRRTAWDWLHWNTVFMDGWHFPCHSPV